MLCTWDRRHHDHGHRCVAEQPGCDAAVGECANAAQTTCAADDRVHAGAECRVRDLRGWRFDRRLHPDAHCDAAGAQVLDLGRDVTLALELVGGHGSIADTMTEKALIAVVGDEVAPRLEQREGGTERVIRLG